MITLRSRSASGDRGSDNIATHRAIRSDGCGATFSTHNKRPCHQQPAFAFVYRHIPSSSSPRSVSLAQLPSSSTLTIRVEVGILATFETFGLVQRTFTSQVKRHAWRTQAVNGSGSRAARGLRSFACPPGILLLSADCLSCNRCPLSVNVAARSTLLQHNAAAVSVVYAAAQSRCRVFDNCDSKMASETYRHSTN